MKSSAPIGVTRQPANPRAGAHLTPKVAQSVDEFCASVGIGRTLFYRLVKEGQIRPIKVGEKRTLVPIQERDAFLARLSREVA